MSDLKVALIDFSAELFDIKPAVQAAMEATLAQAGARLEIAQCRSEAETLAVAGDADLVMIQSLRPLLTESAIAQLPRCRALMRLGLGYDSIDVAAATRQGIPVSNVVDWCDDEVAEHAIALLFACIRRLAPLDQAMHRGRWAKEIGLPTARISGKTLGLVAFGRVARMVARKLSGFGLRLIVWSESTSPEAARRYGVELVSLDELLRSSDFISLHSALTPEREHLIGPDELTLLKPGAILINTARGGLIDEAALIDALKRGKLGAAGLDVFETEPLAVDSPLASMDHVLLTPHMASFSSEAVDTLYEKSARIAANLLQSRWVHTIVNPDVRPQAEKRWGAFESMPEIPA